MKARSNPFSSVKLEQLEFRFGSLTMADIMERLESQHYRGALVGPKGSGKTTLLEQMDRELQARGFQTEWIRLHRDDCPSWPHKYKMILDHPNPSAILLFDGAELLAPLEWWSFVRKTRSTAGLIITTHREGRLPTLYHCRPSLKVLRSLVAELTPTGEQAVMDQAEALYAKHHGNIREALREYYDIYSQREAV